MDDGSKSNDELKEAIAMLQQLQPALKQWTHLRPPGKTGLDRAG
jgi:hypothetical protein